MKCVCVCAGFGLQQVCAKHSCLLDSLAMLPSAGQAAVPYCDQAMLWGVIKVVWVTWRQQVMWLCVSPGAQVGHETKLPSSKPQRAAQHCSLLVA